MFSLTLGVSMYTVSYLTPEGDTLTAVFNDESIALDFADTLDEEGIINTGVTFHTIH
jgi:hypothetical protein